MSKTMKTVKRMPVVQEAAEQIYLAGLGAFALAEEEGSKVFENLVEGWQGPGEDEQGPCAEAAEPGARQGGECA